MLHVYAHRIADLIEEAEGKRVRVSAVVLGSLNGREPEPLVDPEVDLAAEPLSVFGHADWILPYTKPLGTGWLDRVASSDPAPDGARAD